MRESVFLAGAFAWLLAMQMPAETSAAKGGGTDNGAPRVMKVMPGSVEVVVGGPAVEVVLEGVGLDRFGEIAAYRDQGSSTGIVAEWTGTETSRRTILISARPSVSEDGAFKLSSKVGGDIYQVPVKGRVRLPLLADLAVRRADAHGPDSPSPNAVGFEISNVGKADAMFPAGGKLYAVSDSALIASPGPEIGNRALVIPKGHVTSVWFADPVGLERGVRITIDPSQAVGEIDEENNAMVIAMAKSDATKPAEQSVAELPRATKRRRSRTRQREDSDRGGGLPDLQIMEAVPEPAQATLNDFRRLDVTILNAGSGNAVFSKNEPVLDFAINGGTRDSVPLRGIDTIVAPGRTITVAIDPSHFETAGDYTIRFFADPADVVKESDEDDNEFSHVLVLDETARSDLVVKSVTTEPAEPKVGENFYFKVTVTNAGRATAALTDEPTLDFAGRLVFGSVHLGPGARKTFTLKPADAERLAGTRTSYVWVDPRNGESERDEENNGLSFSYTVVP